MPWKMIKIDERNNTVFSGKRQMAVPDLKMDFDECVETRHRKVTFQPNHQRAAGGSGSSVGTVFFFFACSVGACTNEKFRHRSSGGSLSRVRCWLGRIAREQGKP